MISFDGFKDSRPLACTSNGVDRPCDHSLAIQNAATAPDDFLTVPRYGQPLGPVRVEPIAKGGIFGKGLWLEKNAGLRFIVPEQSNNPNRLWLNWARDWYVGLFVDPRWNGPGNKAYSRTVISLGSSKRIELAKKSTSQPNVAFDHVRLVDGRTVLSETPLPSGLKFFRETDTHGGWRHLAFQFSETSAPRLMIDGMVVAAIKPLSGIPSSRVNGFFTVNENDQIGIGAKEGGRSGFRGWVDDFKVIAQNVKTIEERCNYARGTMMKLDYSKAHGYWKWRANQYPGWHHNYIARKLRHPKGSKYVCAMDYGNYSMGLLTTNEAYMSLHNDVYGGESVREKLLIGDARLEFGKPRPDYTGHSFCLSCHLPESQMPFAELNIKALQVKPGVKMENDPRRQPLQPPADISGIIPANYFGSRKPASTLKTNSAPHKVDQWISK